MKKLYCLILMLCLLLHGVIAFSQAIPAESEILPNQKFTDSRPFVHATVMDDDTWCEVVWGWYPPYWELVYDDGEADDYFIYANSGSMNANRFTPYGYPINIIGGRIYVGDGSFPGPFLGTSFQVLVYDDDGEDGLPGTALDSMDVTVNNYGWVEFEGMTANISEGDFYLAMKQTAPSPNAAPVGVDNDNPTYFISYCYFQGAPGWVLSPLQDFMIRAWVVGYEEPSRDIDYYQLDRFSGFDPDGSPILGDTTLLDTTSNVYYNDTNWAGLEAGWYAYGLKTHYTSGEWTDYDVSNIVPHLLNHDLTINVDLCDTTWPDLTEVTLEGSSYPYWSYSLNGSGALLFEEVFEGYYTITATAPGNSAYVLENVYWNDDSTINISLICPHYPARNTFADPVTLHASWDPPQVVMLDDDFEQDGFPPPGWQALSDGNGWFRTTDGSGAGWNIPGWDSYYACTNDLLVGENNGSTDYLIMPVLDLRYTYNFILSFNSYFDGSNGQEAFAEYSMDGDPYWDIWDQIEPSTSWEYIELDLSAFSGPESEPVWFAFHADDNGQDASGWAIDGVRVYSPDPPASLIDYYVYLDDSLIAITDTTSINLPVLSYGQEYTLCVKSHYPSGLSEAECTTFTSVYLYPPSCFYQADTGNQPLIICPPLDSTGAVPFNFMGYNLHLNGSFITFLPSSTTTYDPEWPSPIHTDAELTGVFDLTPFGFPGETGESMPQWTNYIMRWGYPLDFLENWSLGNFDENNWTAEGPNWSITGQVGNPSPAAEFTWDPIQNDYSMSLESYPFLADSMFAGQIYLDFDIKLDAVMPTGNEFLFVQVWNWESQAWSTAKTYLNDYGSFGWVSEHLEITDYAINKVFKIRFTAQGESSVNLLWWLVDNIHVYRDCNEPYNLDVMGSYNGIQLTWDGIEYDQWIHWDDGVYSGTSIGTSGADHFDVAARWIPSQLADYDGYSLTQIAFFPGEEAATYQLRVWIGQGAANLIVDQPVENPLIDQWNIVTLTTPVVLDVSKELWVGYRVNNSTGYPAGVDNGPAIDGYGNMVNLGGWQTLLQINPELDFNWNIQAYLYKNIQYNSSIKYAIYRYDDAGPYFLRDYSDQNFYMDDSVCGLPPFFHGYKVTALHISGIDTCESDFSNEGWESCDGLNENNQESYINIYPNPSNDFIRIESSEELRFISIYNSFGELMLKKKVDDRHLEIPVPGYPPGVYMIRVETEKETISRKVLIIH